MKSVVNDEVADVCVCVRCCLPAPMISRNALSVWTILKQCIGRVRCHAHINTHAQTHTHTHTHTV